MALPERLFYPLDKAVKVINKDMNTDIDIEDLLHFGMIGKLQLCTYLNISSLEYDIAINITVNNQTSDNIINSFMEDLQLATIKNDFGEIQILPNSEINFYTLRMRDGLLNENSLPDRLIVISGVFKLSSLIALQLELFNKGGLFDFSHDLSINLGSSFSFPRNSGKLKFFTELSGDLDYASHFVFHSVKIKPKENKKITIGLSNIVISSKEIEIFKNGGLDIPKLENNDGLELTCRPGQKSHPLQDETILIARNTKNHYLEKDIDLGLASIATKIKNHRNYINKGLPSTDQMVKWFRGAGIEASKTTRIFDFELILKE